jgi:hypothetical protein
MPDRARTVVTLAIDTYDPVGRLVGSTLHARCSSGVWQADDLAPLLWEGLPPDWRQVTYAEAVELFSHQADGSERRWEQLSIF